VRKLIYPKPTVTTVQLRVQKALQADKNCCSISTTRSALADAAEVAENEERCILAAEKLADTAVRSAVTTEAAVGYLRTAAEQLETVTTVPAVLRDLMAVYQAVNHTELLAL
jgi:hypothetical protein